MTAGAPSCGACGAENTEGSRFCSQCGARLDAPLAAAAPASPAPPEAPTPGQYADATGVEERRIATVLFADLAGFTSMSEAQDPEDVKALATHCADLMSSEVKRFGGTVTGIMGDAIMGVFGAPVAHEDDPERAIRAAIAMRDVIRAQELGPRRLDLHVGINTGETMAGLIGPRGRQDYTAMGDTTNTAARLMSHAPTGCILVGEQTYIETRQSIVYRPAEPIAAKGKSEPVQVWEVLEAPPVPQPRPLGTAPFVGRKDELRDVAELWNRVRREHRACSLTLLGPAGIGKTRLLREATTTLEGAPPILWGRCLPYGEGITYWPVVEMVTSAAGILHGDDTTTKLRKLGQIIESLPTHDEDQIQSIATALSNLLGLSTTPRGTYIALQISRGELHWGIRRFLELLALHRYLVLVFEDLHWAEPTMLELVGYLSDSPAPVLVLASSRPDAPAAVRSSREGDRHRVTQLPGLTEDEAAAVLSDLVHEAPGSTRLAPLIRAAGGNPLFLEETLRMLTTAGTLAEGSALAELIDEMPIPTSVQGLIGSRLDLLPAEQKRLAQHGSVIGQVFWSGGVAHIGRWHRPIDADLRSLEEREVVESHLHSELAGEHEFAFRHILIRDVAYGRLPKGERALLHSACAEWLALHPSQRDELVEIVAYHLEQACRLAPRVGPRAAQRPLREAVDALVTAAAKAERRDGAREAERFYTRALELTGVDAQTAVDLRIKRARATVTLGELAGAETELTDAAERAREVDRPDLRGQALVTLANIYLKQGRASDAARCIVEAQAIAVDVDDRWLQIRAAYELSSLRGDFEGNADSAIEALRAAVQVAEQIDDLPLQIEGHLRIGFLLLNLGMLSHAEAESARVLRLAGPLGSNRDKARATHMLAVVTFYRSGPLAAQPIEERALKWAERVGDRYFQLQSLRILAKCQLASGAPDAAEGYLRTALDLAKDSGGWLVVEICRFLVEALVDLGRIREAAGVAAHARASMPPEDDYAVAAVLLSEALVSAGGVDPGGAWNSFAEAMRLMEQQQLWLDLGDAQILHARVLARAGLRLQAEDALEQACALFSQLEADAVVADVERELRRLSQKAAD